MTGVAKLERLLRMQLRALGEKSYARPQHHYGDPAKFVKFQGEGKDMLRRVKKEDVIVHRFSKEDPLTRLLDIWKRWTERDDHATQHRDRQSDHDEYDEIYMKGEIKAAEAMNAMIFDLPRHYRWAIQKRCGVSTSCWNYPHLVFADVLADAEAVLIKKMEKNHDTGHYF